MILVYGTLCLDRVRHVYALPSKGGYAEVLSQSELLGGEASNSGVALAKWGAEVVLFGNPIGTGPEADFILRSLVECGIRISSPISADHAAPYCDIFVTDDGDRTMFGYGFAPMATEVDPSKIPVQADAWFTADPNHGAAAYRAANLAHEAGMRVYLLDFVDSAAPVPPGSIMQSSTDFVGSRGNTQKNVEWVRTFAERNNCLAILSDGPNGFSLGLPEGIAFSYPPFPCPKMLDSTGAGDVFRAGMLLGLSQGWSMADCLRFASAAGCLNCASWGGNSGVPSLDEVRDLIKANPSVSRQYELDLPASIERFYARQPV